MVVCFANYFLFKSIWAPCDMFINLDLKAFVKHVFRKSFLQHQHFCTGPFVLKADNLLVFWSSSIEIGDRCSRAAHKKSFDSIHLSDCRSLVPKDPFQGTIHKGRPHQEGGGG